jgi:hypothetical protein
LGKNLEKIDWGLLSENPSAISILEKNNDKIDWSQLCLNPNATPLLKNNQDKIDWNLFVSNPSIFDETINYRFLKRRMIVIREELMMKCYIK